MLRHAQHGCAQLIPKAVPVYCRKSARSSPTAPSKVAKSRLAERKVVPPTAAPRKLARSREAKEKSAPAKRPKTPAETTRTPAKRSARSAKA